MDNKNQEQSAYEKMWQEAFEDAQITPSADLWKNIDNRLTQQESGKYRRGFFFYRAVAAACLLCLLGLGIYTVNDYFRHQDNTPLSQAPAAASEKASPSEPTETPSELGQRNRSAKENEAADPTTQNPAIASNDTQETPPSQETLTSKTQRNRTLAAARETETSNMTQATLSQESDRRQAGTTASLSLLASQGIAEDHTATMAWLAEIDQLYLVPNPYATQKEKANKKDPSFFAGLNFSGGYFDPNINMASSANTLAMGAFKGDKAEFGYLSNESTDYGAASQGAGVDNQPQVSLSYGAEVGMHLSEHITLESGIDYGKFNTSTETNLAIESLESDKRYPLVASNSAQARVENVSGTTATELNNAFELLSVPMKIGYHVLFDKVNLFLSSGMAANFFLQNSISDTNGKFAPVNIQSDTESPYRKIFYSGVITGGVHYNFSRNYFFTLAPEYNFSLTPMTKEGAIIHSQPFSFGIDVGLRYNFK